MLQQVSTPTLAFSISAQQKIVTQRGSALPLPLQRREAGTQEAQEAQKSQIYLVPFVLLVFLSVFLGLKP
jgi:hypothetical protein